MPGKRSLSRTGRPFAVLVVVCATTAAAVLTGVTSPLAALPFANTGHWVYNSVVGAVFHLDGATGNVDAQLGMNAEDGSQVVQDDTSGFVVGTERITEFDKASLTPGEASAPPSGERAVTIEAVGGPYAVYRNAGTVVRLGDPAAVIPAGGAISAPVVAEDGTMWLHRTGSGEICRLNKDAAVLSGCPVSAPRGHAGALTIVDGKPGFVDLSAGRLHTIEGDRFGAGVRLGISLSPNAKPAARNTNGKLAILDPARGRLVLVNTRSRPAEPLPVALAAGDYDGPVATDDAVVLVDRQKGTVLTFGMDGTRKETTPFRNKNGEPRLSQGDDNRIYVEDADGAQVVVVGGDGRVRDVDVKGGPDRPPRTQAAPPPGRTSDPAPPEGQRPPPPDRPANPPVTTNPRVTTNPPPPPVPPSRPGAPGRVSAQAANGAATVTWGAAASNRAPITAYLVTWQGGSRQFGPAARRGTIPNLANGRAYVFTVTATNRVGTGPGVSSNAVTPVAPRPQPKVVLSKGNPTEDSCGDEPDCAWMHIVMTGFASNTSYHVEPYNNANDGYSNPGYRTTTDDNGSEDFERFAYTGPGETVWVEVSLPGGGVVRSNPIVW